jgi:hypothetical protein
MTRRTLSCPRPSCRASFIQKRANQRYCSRTCALCCARARREGRDLEALAQRTCADCHAPLGFTAHGGRDYCSRTCWQRARRHRARPPQHMRNCGRCRVPFVTRRLNQRYCTAWCRSVAKRPPALIRGPYNPRSTRVTVTRWTLLDEPFESDGFAYARCRCQHGHEQVVAVDVRPAPACERCQTMPGPVGRALETTGVVP